MASGLVPRTIETRGRETMGPGTVFGSYGRCKGSKPRNKLWRLADRDEATILKWREHRCGESTRLPPELSCKAENLQPAAAITSADANANEPRAHQNGIDSRRWGDAQPRGDCGDGV